MRVVTLVGARPQFIKASVVSRAFADAGIEEIIVHSGQHYDDRVSKIFFDELEIPLPHTNLAVGSGPHGWQTGQMMEKLEALLQELGRLDWLLVYGDTNTTLAGALVAAKMHIPIAHVEAGLRSFNRQMPEEINRVITDQISDALFCPTQTAVDNLANEGREKGVFLSGDVMYDATLFFSQMALEKKMVKVDLNDFYLATVHRASNTDNPVHLKQIMDGLGRLDAPVILPLHPRTRSKLANIDVPASVHIKEPVGYLEMLTLIQQSKAVITDSGGLQKEAFWLQKPCITLREQTEWVETLEGNWNQLTGADPEKLLAAVEKMPPQGSVQKPFGGTGDASRLIARSLGER